MEGTTSGETSEVRWLTRNARQACAGLAELWDGLQERRRVGMTRLAEHLLTRPILYEQAAIEHRELVAHVADETDVMRDKHDRHPGSLLEFHQQVEILALRRHIQSGRGFVGDEQGRGAANRRSAGDPLAHAATEFVRVAVNPQLRRDDFDHSEQLHNAPQGGTPGHVLMHYQRFAHLRANGEHRIEGRQGILQHHANLLPPHTLDSGLRGGYEVCSLQPNLSRDDAGTTR